jgi:hypothetical protein
MKLSYIVSARFTVIARRLSRQLLVSRQPCFDVGDEAFLRSYRLEDYLRTYRRRVERSADDDYPRWRAFGHGSVVQPTAAAATNGREGRRRFH